MSPLHSNIFKLILSFVLSKALTNSSLHSNIFKLIRFYTEDKSHSKFALHSNIFKLIHNIDTTTRLIANFTF